MTSAIEKIHRFEKFGSVLGLDRMRELARRLGNPERELKCIHVGGTNGKGSVCRYIYEILRESDYRTGLYISPFVERFHERIEFDGRMIADDDLEICADQVLFQAGEMVKAGFDSPTEFEIVTAIAFVYFQRVRAAFVVLEVGLGGAGDSTNIIETPLVSVITSISYDHMDTLGGTLTQIAGEKAGIIKEGVPVVTNGLGAEAEAVIAARVAARNAARYDAGSIGYTVTGKTLKGWSFDADVYGTAYQNAKISMLGAHQVQNALTALTAIEVLKGRGTIETEAASVNRGLEKAAQIGRFEVVSERPCVIFDGAHNESGLRALRDAMEEHFPGERPLVVFGMLADKDTARMIEIFGEIADDFIATEPANPRKLPADEARDLLRRAGKRCVSVPDADAAFRLAMEKKEEFPVILFAGSLYLIGQVRRMYDAEHRKEKGAAVL